MSFGSLVEGISYLNLFVQKQHNYEVLNMSKLSNGYAAWLSK